MQTYTIHGSEDGIIATATSAHKAIEIAVAYVKRNGGGAYWNGKHLWDFNNEKLATAHLQKAKTYNMIINNCDDETVARSGYSEAEIEKFTANYYGSL